MTIEESVRITNQLNNQFNSIIKSANGIRGMIPNFAVQKIIQQNQEIQKQFTPTTNIVDGTITQFLKTFTNHINSCGIQSMPAFTQPDITFGALKDIQNYTVNINAVQKTFSGISQALEQCKLSNFSNLEPLEYAYDEALEFVPTVKETVEESRTQVKVKTGSKTALSILLSFMIGVLVNQIPSLFDISSSQQQTLLTQNILTEEEKQTQLTQKILAEEEKQIQIVEEIDRDLKNIYELMCEWMTEESAED